jgi:phosphoribosylformylglycinamidine (FGAM) synthase-like enzyme
VRLSADVVRDRCGFAPLGIPVTGGNVSFYIRSMREARRLPANRIGVSHPVSDPVEAHGLFTVSLEELRSSSKGVLPGLFG